MTRPIENFLKRYGAYCAVILFCAVISSPVLDNGFVNYDDPRLLIEPAAQGKLNFNYKNLIEALLPHPGASYTPTRTLTFMVCHAIGGEAPVIYHLASLILYCLLCLAVYFFARCMLNWDDAEFTPAGSLSRSSLWALFASFVFTAHPLNVESLAWISAIKDLFAALFWLACVLSFILMEKGWKAGRIFILLFFILALVSKPSSLMLPLVIAVFILFKPFKIKLYKFSLALIVTAILVVVAYSLYLSTFLNFFNMYRHSGGLGSVFSGAIKVFLAYLKAFILPLNLSVRYLVKVPLNFFNAESMLYLCVFLVLILLVVIAWRRGTSLPALALCWMLLALLPTFGFVPLEILRADRYALTSVPILAVLLAYSLRAIELRLPSSYKKVFLLACWFIPFFFAVLFVNRLRVWHSSETLWKAALAVEPKHYIALNSLGLCYTEQGDTAKAIDYIHCALEANPTYVKAMNSLGLLYESTGKKSEAEALFKKAAEQPYNKDQSFLNLGTFYLKEGRIDQAEEYLKEASALSPLDARIHYQLGVCYQKKSEFEKASAEMRRALSIEPVNTLYLVGLGRLLITRGELMDGLDLLEQALQIDKNYVPAYLGLGELFWKSGKFDDARTAYEAALKIEPDNYEALHSLGSILGLTGKIEGAAEIFKRLKTEHPSDCEALGNMAAIYITQGLWEEALSQARAAIECDSMQVSNYLNAYKACVYLHRFNEAEKIISIALRISPQSPDIVFARFYLSFQAGNKPDTSAYYLEKLLRMNLNSDLKARVMYMADRMKKGR